MKSNYFLLCLAFLGLFTTAKAQLGHPHFLSLNAGTNIPASDYKNIDSLTSSGANMGIYYSFEAAVYFSKVMGIGLNVGAFSNSVDNDGIVDQLKRDANFSDGNFNISSNNWTNGYIMLGPYLSFGKKKFIVDFKVLGGIVNSERPLINIESTTNQYKFNSSAVYKTSLGVNYGMHFRIQLKKKLALRINGEGILTTQEFTERIRTISQSGVSNPEIKRTVEREISTLNLGVGLMINL